VWKSPAVEESAIAAFDYRRRCCTHVACRLRNIGISVGYNEVTMTFVALLQRPGFPNCNLHQILHMLSPPTYVFPHCDILPFRTLRTMRRID